MPVRRLLALPLIVAAALTVRAQTPAPAAVAFVNVNVVPMDANRVLADQTVVIRDGRIAALGASASTPAPAGATVVDGRGKYLMPGLAEMHGHVPAPTANPVFAEQVMFLYVASGVTTVRGMQGAAGQLDLRDRAVRQEIVGPMLYLAGPQFSGQTAPTPDAASARVRAQKQEGWDLLKVQVGMTVESYDAMARTAREIGIDFGGHVPVAVGVEHALAAGQKTFDHMDYFAETLGGDKTRVTDEAIAGLVAKVKAAGTWVVPTLYVWETLRGPVSLESRTALARTEVHAKGPGRAMDDAVAEPAGERAVRCGDGEDLYRQPDANPDGAAQGGRAHPARQRRASAVQRAGELAAPRDATHARCRDVAV